MAKLTTEEFLDILKELYWLDYPHDVTLTFEDIFRGEDDGEIIQFKPRDLAVKELAELLKPAYGNEATEVAERSYDYVVSELGDNYSTASRKLWNIAWDYHLSSHSPLREPGIEFKRRIVDFEDLYRLHYQKVKRFYPDGNEKIWDEIAYTVAISDVLSEFYGEPSNFEEAYRDLYYEIGWKAEDETFPTASGYEVSYTSVEDALPTYNDREFPLILAKNLYEAGFYPDPKELLAQPYDQVTFLELLSKKFPKQLVKYFENWVSKSDEIFKHIYELVKQNYQYE